MAEIRVATGASRRECHHFSCALAATEQKKSDGKDFLRPIIYISSTDAQRASERRTKRLQSSSVSLLLSCCLFGRDGVPFSPPSRVGFARINEITLIILLISALLVLPVLFCNEIEKSTEF